MSVFFATALTEDYLPRAERLLDSLADLTSCLNYVVSVRFKLSNGDGYTSRRLDHSSNCCQQGQVLDVLPELTDGRDTLVMADADAVVQRNPTLSELEFLHGLGENEIVIGPNRLVPEFGDEEFVEGLPKKTLE